MKTPWTMGQKYHWPHPSWCHLQFLPLPPAMALHLCSPLSSPHVAFAKTFPTKGCQNLGKFFGHSLKTKLSLFQFLFSSKGPTSLLHSGKKCFQFISLTAVIHWLFSFPPNPLLTPFTNLNICVLSRERLFVHCSFLCLFFPPNLGFF